MIVVLGWLILACAEDDKGPVVVNGCTLRPVTKTLAAPERKEIWQLTLDDGINIALNNSESVRVLWTPTSEQIPNSCCFGPRSTITTNYPTNHRPTKSTSKMVVSPVDANTPMWRFNAEVMALIRTTEQQYWNLAHKQALLESWSKAIELTEAILKAEKNELTAARGASASVAEAEQRLEEFQCNLITAKSDVTVAERQLRNTLGLPPVDSRQIVPVTAPRNERAEPCWDECVASMSTHQPDVVRQEENVRRVEWLSRNVALALAGSGPVKNLDLELVASVETQLALETIHQRELLSQVQQQAGRPLSRCFQDVAANDKLWQAASRLRAASEKRLEVQRVFYKERRIPLARYLDAISTNCAAKAREVQAKTAYTGSLTMLEEAKGTLLATLGIEVREAARRLRDSAWDNAVRSASLELDLVPASGVPDEAEVSPHPAPAASLKR